MAGIFGWHFRAPKATAFASLRCLVQILIFVDVFSQCYNASKATASRFDPVALSLSLSRHGFGFAVGIVAAVAVAPRLRLRLVSLLIRPTAYGFGCCRLYALRLASAGIVAHTRHGLRLAGFVAHTAYGWLSRCRWLASAGIVAAAVAVGIVCDRHGFGFAVDTYEKASRSAPRLRLASAGWLAMLRWYASLYTVVMLLRSVARYGFGWLRLRLLLCFVALRLLAGL